MKAEQPQASEELRRLAAGKMAQEPPGQTLQATALVHEAYLRLIASECPEDKIQLLIRERRAFTSEQLALGRAQAAEQKSQEDLWHALVTQARANRLSGAMGRTQLGLKAIAEAARLKTSAPLRDEAVAP